MRVLVTGDRYWRDKQAVCMALDTLYNEWVDRLTGSLSWDTAKFIVVQGECKDGGADLHAKKWAIEKQKSDPRVGHEDHPALWSKYGKVAGPIRNTKMVMLGADEGLYFHNQLEKSKGTKDCVKKAREAGIRMRTLRMGELVEM